MIWQYRLEKISGSVPPVTRGLEPPPVPERREGTVTRIIRDTDMANRVKADYDFKCQICGVRLEGPAGPRAEGAHIRGLGRPHNGPDVRENILCLCPNHHTLLDIFGIAVADSFALIGMQGVLTLRKDHKIALEYVRYHLSQYDAVHAQAKAAKKA